MNQTVVNNSFRMSVVLVDTFSDSQTGDGSSISLTAPNVLPAGVIRYMDRDSFNRSVDSNITTPSTLTLRGAAVLEYEINGTTPWSLLPATKFEFENLTGASFTFRVNSQGGGFASLNLTPTGSTMTILFTDARLASIDFSRVTWLGIEFSTGTTTTTLFAADPHVLCLDGSRIDVYAPGFYRYYDNGASNPHDRVIANVEVQENARGQDFAAALWVWSYGTGALEHRFDENQKLFDTNINGEKQIKIDVHDPLHDADLTFIMEGEYNTVGMEAKWSTQIAHVGGAMACRVQTVPSIDSMDRVETRNVALFLNCVDNAHALVCGSGDPHIVSFYGGRTAVEPSAENVLLLGCGEISVVVSFDENRHIKQLNIIDASAKRMSVLWDGNTTDQSLSTMHVACDGEKTTCIGAEGIHELWVGHLFVRVQPGGVASFQIIGKSILESAQGLLVAPMKPTMKPGNGKAGLYAKLVEPHLLGAQSRVASEV